MSRIPMRPIWLILWLILCGIAVAQTSAPATSSPSRGKVIYIRRDGEGVLIHTEHGDLQLSFPAPTIVRLRDRTPSSPASAPSPFVSSSNPAAKFDSLDPRYQILETEALRVEIQPDPFGLTIKDRQGNLLLQDTQGGLMAFDEKRTAWTARYAPQGPIRGFGAIRPLDPTPSTAIRFDEPTSSTHARALHLSPAPFGRLSDRCAVLFRVEGEAQLRLPERGVFVFESGGLLDACICLTDSDEQYWQTLSFLLGRPAFLPSWLLGTGYALEQCNSLVEVRSLASRLKTQGFPVDYLCFYALRPAIAGWNAPFGALGLGPVWAHPRPSLDVMAEQGAHAVFEIPAHFAATATVTSMSEVLAARQTESGTPTPDDQPAGLEEDASAPSSQPAAVDMPLDFANTTQMKAFAEQLAFLRDNGLTRYLMSEDERPANDPSGAARPAQRAQAWADILLQPGAPERRFVLDREARADVLRRAHTLAPWRVDPRIDQPSEAFHAAEAAAWSGLPMWGLELPTSPSAYPSSESLNSWLGAALVAPQVLLRAPSWSQADPPQDVADINFAFKRLFAVRARLRPYLYTLMRTASLTCVPVCRPWPGAMPPRVGALSVGPDTLFLASDPDAPGSIAVNLPAGQWNDLNSGALIEGGRKLDVSLAPNVLNAYARAGTIFPYWGEIAKSDSAYFVLRLYPSSKGQYALYEDAGEGNEYANGAFAVTQLLWEYQPADSTLEINIAGPIGDYAASVSPRDLVLQVSLHRLPQSVFIDDKPARRTKFVTGGSALLDPKPPLQFSSSTMPLGATWDHDGQNFLYVWLPERSSNTKIRLFLNLSLTSTGEPLF